MPPLFKRKLDVSVGVIRVATVRAFHLSLSFARSKQPNRFQPFGLL